MVRRPLPIAGKFSGATPVCISTVSPDFHRTSKCDRIPLNINFEPCTGEDAEPRSMLLIQALGELKKDPCLSCWPEDYFVNEKTVHTMQEPPMGSVVAIDWGKHRQEVWVSNSANVGNWYTTDVPLKAGWHPNWYDVLERATGHTLTLLVVADADTYETGRRAGIAEVKETVMEVIEGLE